MQLTLVLQFPFFITVDPDQPVSDETHCTGSTLFYTIKSGPCRNKTCLRGFEQQRPRPAGTSAQTDQRLCYLLTGKLNI